VEIEMFDVYGRGPMGDNTIEIHIVEHERVLQIGSTLIKRKIEKYENFRLMIKMIFREANKGLTFKVIDER
jgi:hypothetical protein